MSIGGDAPHAPERHPRIVTAGAWNFPSELNERGCVAAASASGEIYIAVDGRLSGTEPEQCVLVAGATGELADDLYSNGPATFSLDVRP